jgi:hypothetical protein
MTTTQCDSPQTLVLKTRSLTNNYAEGLATLSHHTGIPFHWLHKFAGGRIPNPRANRLQFLYEFLTGKPLVK